MFIKSKHLRFQIFLIIMMVIAGWYFYDRLPEVIVSHRNIYGVADGFQNKSFLTVFLIPLISLVVLVGMKLTPYFDPRKEKYQYFQSTYEIIQTVMVALFAYFYGVVMLLNLDSSWNISTFVLLGMGVMLILVGNYLPKIKQNYFIGIKTPWTLHDEEIWNKTHRMGGISYVLLGVSLLVNSYFVCFLVWHLVFVFVVLLFPILYSYWLSIEKKKITLLGK